MAKKVVSNSTENKLSNSIFKTSRGQKFIVGVFFIIIAVILLVSFISYYISGSNDQSQISELGNRAVVVENWFGKIGAWLSDAFLHKGFGISSFLFVKIFFRHLNFKHCLMLIAQVVFRNIGKFVAKMME